MDFYESIIQNYKVTINSILWLQFLLYYICIFLQDFLVQLIHQEKSEAQTLHNMTPSNERFKSMSKDLLADPLIFLRKWMGEVSAYSGSYNWSRTYFRKWIKMKNVVGYCFEPLLGHVSAIPISHKLLHICSQNITHCSFTIYSRIIPKEIKNG